jgi:hypothetical protein
VNLANEKADTAVSDADNDGDQRSSLPEISLTSREKSELENLMQSSLSNESILALIPPPKPSKERKHSHGPPLPPKTRIVSVDETSTRDSSESKVMCSGMIDLNSSDEMDALEKFDSTTTDGFFDNQTNSVSQFFTKTVSVEKSFATITLNEHIIDVFDEQPPPIPMKTRIRSLRSEHHRSVYDNIDDNRISDTKMSSTSSNSSLTSSLSARDSNQEMSSCTLAVKAKYKSCIENGSDFGMDTQFCRDNPPPLPLKKKHSK